MIISLRAICYLFILLLLQACAITPSSTSETVTESSKHNAAIASAHPLATQAGVAILKQGGNAFDAAIAVTAALAVVEPYSSGLGGGGFYLLHQAENDRYLMLDARERAPLLARKDLYLDNAGNVIPDASITGPLSAGIPGIPAALVVLAEQYGQLKLTQSLAPAIQFAREGFAVDEIYQRMAGFRLKALQKNAEASRLFLDNGKVPALNHKIVQQDLAKTLERIAHSGLAGFYDKEVADLLVADVQRHGGIWSKEDLQSYQVKERSPELASYKDMKMVFASLPSSGGLVLSQIFAMLNQFDIEAMTKAQRIHIIAEAMRRAYRDRAEYLGDPDFIEVPSEQLVSEDYIASLVKTIRASHATPSAELKPVAQPSGPGTDTTHFSIIDEAGNKVSATLSINYPFGSCFVAKGTGILLNDEMDDFASKPGVPNVYGLVGSHANAIEPGKRMLSSMTPSIVETRDRVAVIGTPGGSRIITMVLLGILDFYENKTADEVVNAGRFHHQYLPDQISYEPDALEEDVLGELNNYGHKTQLLDHQYGNMQMIIIDKKTGLVDAASDNRGVGKAVVIE